MHYVIRQIAIIVSNKSNYFLYKSGIYACHCITMAFIILKCYVYMNQSGNDFVKHRRHHCCKDIIYSSTDMHRCVVLFLIAMIFCHRHSLSTLSCQMLNMSTIVNVIKLLFWNYSLFFKNYSDAYVFLHLLSYLVNICTMKTTYDLFLYSELKCRSIMTICFKLQHFG